ncbi:MAG: hypothetical protein ABH843_00585 [Candidatus Omnitrophota bacterium]
MIYKYYIYILLVSLTLFSYLPTAVSLPETTQEAEYSVKKAIGIADEKQKEAQKKANAINKNFLRGKDLFRSGNYKEAMGYFEDILVVDPTYEPAKLYIESALIYIEIIKEQEEINKIKMKMADIIFEFERRRELMGNLAMNYFLEKAQQKCQGGDYKGTEEYYNLCYKINPYSKDKIEWFIKATHDLVKLNDKLDEHARRIEDLAVFEP